MEKKTPVIIDCDPGYDDAMALVLALGNSHLDVKAITTVSGNVGIDRTYKNALRLCHFLGKDVPVGKGAAKPLIKKRVTGKNIHSNTGLSDVNIPEDIPMPKEVSAIELIKQCLESSAEKVTILMLGPSTNIATLLTAYPHLKSKIDSLVLMGGAAVGGNVTLTAEFNIYADAEAAKIVFESGLPIVMAGLDITNNFQIAESDFGLYRKLGKVGLMVGEILEAYYIPYKARGPRFKGPALHDMLPIAYVIDKTLFHGSDCHVGIECQGELTYGQTLVDFGGKRNSINAKILLSCNQSAIIEIFKKTIGSYETFTG